MRDRGRLRCQTNSNVILIEEKNIEDIEKGKRRPNKSHKTSRDKHIRQKQQLRNERYEKTALSD